MSSRKALQNQQEQAFAAHREQIQAARKREQEANEQLSNAVGGAAARAAAESRRKATKNEQDAHNAAHRTCGDQARINRGKTPQFRSEKARQATP